MKLREQEELRCTCRLTGRIRCFASKTATQHVSKPNVLMNARLQRLGRYYKGKPVLVWCYPLQELPNGIRVDGDGGWAPTTELLAGPQVEVQSGMVCTRGIVTRSQSPRSH